MLKDASHQQVSHNFSFIESLNLSQGKNQRQQAVNPQAQITAESEIHDSAIVTASHQASTIDTNWYELNDSYELNLAEIIKYSASENTVNRSSERRNYLGKILFALSCGYCLFVLWWLFGDRIGYLLTTIAGGRQITLSKSDVEFIDYVERSLAKIDRQLEAKNINSEPDDSMVYVPVYTPTPATPVPQVSSSGLPLTTLTTLPNNGTPTIPPPITPEALKIPAPPPLPEPTSLAANTSESSDPTATASAKPPVKHTLMGVLDLGTGSAALIKVNGQTKRIWLGEKISDSGWILETVTDRTAQISNQGETRSIAVGETF